MIAMILIALALAPSMVEDRRVNPPAVPEAELSQLMADAAQQIRRCYRSPPVGRLGRQVVTRISVRYENDGTLAQMPIVVSQAGVTLENRLIASVMSEAAVMAVVRCAPLRLAPQFYQGGWDAFELTFSPAGTA